MQTWFLLLLFLPFPLGIADEDKKADHVGTLSHEEIHSAHGQRGAEMCRNNQLDPGSIDMSGSATGDDIDVHGHAHGQDGHAHSQGHHVLGSSLDTESQPDTEEYYYIENPDTHRVLDVSNEGEVIMANENPTRLTQQWRNESGILINKQSGLALHVQQHSCCNLTLTKTTTEGLSTWIVYKDFIVNVETDRPARLLETHGLSVSLTFDHPMGTTNQKWAVHPVTLAVRPTLVQFSLRSKICPELFEKKEDIKEFQKFDHHIEYPECWEDIKPSFKLFTKTNNCIIADAKTELFDLKKPCSALDELTVMEGLRKIVVITHGFLGKSATGEWPVDMANLIIKHDKDVAVVTVDWSKGAALDWLGFFYDQPAANTRYVGVATARIIDQLRKKLKPKTRFHCIGHSLGAHICGFVGKETAIDRISGMDPAGPLFKRTTKVEERLDSTDATVVDALHTDGNRYGFGLMKPIGDIDFYAGKDEHHYGADQKDCHSWLPYDYITMIGSVCDHSRSHEIYRATIAHGSYTPEAECSWKDATLTNCQVSNKQPRIGYWYQGGFTGLYGFSEKDQP